MTTTHYTKTKYGCLDMQFLITAIRHGCATPRLIRRYELASATGFFAERSPYTAPAAKYPPESSRVD